MMNFKKGSANVLKSELSAVYDKIIKRSIEFHSFEPFRTTFQRSSFSLFRSPILCNRIEFIVARSLQAVEVQEQIALDALSTRPVVLRAVLPFCKCI